MKVEQCTGYAYSRAMAARKHTRGQTLADWDRLRVVLALRRGGTLSAAGRLLGVDHTTVARHLENLEREFSAPIFERGPDGFAATSLGEEVVTAAERMEEAAISLLRRLDGAAAGLTGTVRLTTTPLLANLLFAPALGKLLHLHPRLQVELLGVDQNLDLSRREADLAVRLSRPEVPGMIVRRLGEMAFACYAAVDDLRPFDSQYFLAYKDASGSVALQHHLASFIESERIVLYSNTLQALLAAAEAGLGCALLPCFAADNLTTLRRVPAPRALASVPLWLIYHEDLRRSPRIRVAAAFIGEIITANRVALMPISLPPI